MRHLVSKVYLLCVVSLLISCSPQVTTNTLAPNNETTSIATVGSDDRSTYFRQGLYCAEPPPDTRLTSSLNLTGELDIANLIYPSLATAGASIGPTTGAIRVTSTIADAKITLEGPDLNDQSFQGSKVFASIAPGSYRISGSATGYFPALESLTVLAGQNVEVSIQWVADTEQKEDAQEAEDPLVTDNKSPVVTQRSNLPISESAGSSNGSNLALGLQTLNEVVQLANRTELVEIQRQALYRICEARHNGFLTNEQAFSLQNEVLYTVRVMSFAELLQSVQGVGTSSISDATIAQLISATLNRGRILLPYQNARGMYDVLMIEPDGTISAAFLDSKHYGVIGAQLSPVPQWQDRQNDRGNDQAPPQELPGQAPADDNGDRGDTEGTGDFWPEYGITGVVPEPMSNSIVTLDILCSYRNGSLDAPVFLGLLQAYAGSTNDSGLLNALVLGPDAISKWLNSSCI